MLGFYGIIGFKIPIIEDKTTNNKDKKTFQFTSIKKKTEMREL